MPHSVTLSRSEGSLSMGHERCFAALSMTVLSPCLSSWLRLMRIGGHSQYALFCNLSLVYVSVPTTYQSLSQSLYSRYGNNFMEEKPDSLLKNRNFMLLWSGQLVSWVGTEITNIALPLIVLALTGSTFQAGSIAAIRGAVYALWAIPAGALIDRWNRKTVLVIANLGSGLAMGSIYVALLLKHLTIPQLYLAGAIEGSFFVFANLARFTAFPRVVSKEQFPAAVAQTSVADNLAVLIGPLLGGLLFQTVGAALAFFADSFSYFVNAVSIFFINVPLQLEKTTQKKSFHKELLEGMLFLWRQPMLRFLNLLSAGRTMLESGLYLLIIIVAKEHNASPFIIPTFRSLMKRFCRFFRRVAQAKPARDDAWAASVRRATACPMLSEYAAARCPQNTERPSAGWGGPWVG
jgi:Major Facilitator Superfamily